ncbi:MAG: DDE-type integrase/transposase/recombinase, partial [Chloroflexi bacterium]|nr:DDE-type integrase/transposase/recombinase [Chloroflexota bacterium]
MAAIDLAKSTWYYHHNHKVNPEVKYAYLHPLLKTIACEHPGYGYRRTKEELEATYGVCIGKHTVRRLHQLWDLPLIRSTHSPPPSAIRQAIDQAGSSINLVKGLEDIAPTRVLYTDFTEIAYADGAYKAYLMPLLDHATRYVFGWAAGVSANRDLALEAWTTTKQRFEQLNVGVEDALIHHDQDAVYTSYRWAGTLLIDDRVRLSYSTNGARGNTMMESFFGRFKTENRSLLLDAASVQELTQVVGDRIRYYNDQR